MDNVHDHADGAAVATLPPAGGAGTGSPAPVLSKVPLPTHLPHAQPIPSSLWRIFGWLLFGDFILILMEQVVPRLGSLLLRRHDLSNTAISLIMGTIPMLFGLFIMPIISYRSDQLRTRWGRRIPFMVITTPLIVLSLCAIPFSPMIAGWIDHLMGWDIPGVGAGAGTTAAIRTVTLVFAVTITSYSFFNAVCSACYAYLLPDVVPGQFIGRFMSLLRVFSLAGLFVFTFFFMGLAKDHMIEVFIGVGVLYGLGFLIVCLRVKEPDYGPPTDQRTVNPIAVFRSYARECFRHRLYLWLYAAFALYGISQVAGNLFDILFMNETLGMDEGQMGQVIAWSAIAPLPLAYFCGNLIDRWKSQRVIILFAVLLSIGKLAGYFFIAGPITYVIFTIAYNAVAFFWGVTVAAFLVTLLPKARYGQFVSCIAFVSALVVMVANPVCGLFFDWVGDYRYVYLWPAILTLGLALILWRIYLEWRRCGGPDNYVAP
ncbi:MAG: MFS transporter [Phycisphaeraceae bacterium]